MLTSHKACCRSFLFVVFLIHPTPIPLCRHGTIKLGAHALLEAFLQRLNLFGVIKVGKPNLDTYGRLLLIQLVDKSHSSNHIRWLNGATDHTKHNVVPILINGATSQVRLQLKLEVASCRI